MKLKLECGHETTWPVMETMDNKAYCPICKHHRTIVKDKEMIVMDDISFLFSKDITEEQRKELLEKWRAVKTSLNKLHQPIDAQDRE